MAQKVRIVIEVQDEAEAAAAEAESAPELIELLPEVDVTVMELTADDEDTDKKMDGAVPEHWEDASFEAA